MRAGPFINVFNNQDNTDVNNFRYRDSLTEGYNITPNFFIRGKIDFKNPNNCSGELIKDNVFERHNEHFFNRLFDRDTLFLQSYDINFMYVAGPPMEGLPLLNLNNGWAVYFLTLVGLVLILMALFTYIAISVTKQKNKIEK